MTRLRTGRFGFRILAGITLISFLGNVLNGCGATRPFLNWVSTSFLGLKRPVRGVDHCHQAPGLKMTGAIPLPSLYACLASTLADLPLRLPFPHRKRVCISVLPRSCHTARLFHPLSTLFLFPKQFHRLASCILLDVPGGGSARERARAVQIKFLCFHASSYLGLLGPA